MDENILSQYVMIFFNIESSKSTKSDKSKFKTTAKEKPLWNNL